MLGVLGLAARIAGDRPAGHPGGRHHRRAPPDPGLRRHARPGRAPGGHPARPGRCSGPTAPGPAGVPFHALVTGGAARAAGAHRPDPLPGAGGRGLGDRSRAGRSALRDWPALPTLGAGGRGRGGRRRCPGSCAMPGCTVNSWRSRAPSAMPSGKATASSARGPTRWCGPRWSGSCESMERRVELSELNRTLWAARHEAGYLDDIALTPDDKPHARLGLRARAVADPLPPGHRRAAAASPGDTSRFACGGSATSGSSTRPIPRRGCWSTGSATSGSWPRGPGAAPGPARRAREGSGPPWPRRS